MINNYYVGGYFCTSLSQKQIKENSICACIRDLCLYPWSVLVSVTVTVYVYFVMYMWGNSTQMCVCMICDGFACRDCNVCNVRHMTATSGTWLQFCRLIKQSVHKICVVVLVCKAVSLLGATSNSLFIRSVDLTVWILKLTLSYWINYPWPCVIVVLVCKAVSESLLSATSNSLCSKDLYNCFSQ
jgi:hypothetical protein